MDTVKSGLCCGCGVCKGICPKACIHWEKKNGLYVPHVNAQICVSCGICASVCPGLGHVYESRGTATETITGSVRACYNAWSRNPEVRHVSASGGVVSTMIHELIASRKYDGAFCLDSYDYRTQLRTRLYTAEDIAEFWRQSSTPKSRYLPVSHENAVAYVKQNRNARLIFVGTSCAVRGLQAAVKTLKVDPDQYLFIGLFCDKVFNYNVLAYFQDVFASGSTLEALHFKNKESGGWPGDMKLFPQKGEPFYVPLSERAKAKAYFVPERCLYCVDKLNVCADISLGDNYTGKDDSKLGSNSVIIRTQNGADAWETAKAQMEIRLVEIGDIQKAQYLEGRLNNLYFGDVKTAVSECADLNPGVTREQEYTEFESAWKDTCKRARTGAVYDMDPAAVQRQIRKDSKKPNPMIQFAKRVVRFVKRKIK